MAWYNALRDVPISQKDMDEKLHTCMCEENPNVDTLTGDGSWLPCMSEEPDNNLCCKDCIYCQILDNNNNQDENN